MYPSSVHLMSREIWMVTKEDIKTVLMRLDELDSGENDWDWINPQTYMRRGDLAASVTPVPSPPTRVLSPF